MKVAVNFLMKRIEKFMRKHKLDYGDKCICYFDDSNKLAMYYCYRISGDVNITTYNIKTFICDSKYKEHREYYITHFLTDRGMTNRDCIDWAKKVLNDYEAFKNEIIRISKLKPYSRENCTKRAKEYDMNKKFSEYTELFKQILKDS